MLRIEFTANAITKSRRRRTFTTKFNRRLHESLFVELDEVIFVGSHEQANIMKALTTEPEGTKEKKYGKKRANQSQ